MNPLANDWPIKHRADACARTGRPFQAGEHFYTLLFREGDGFRREDLSEEAWAQRNENIRPFSFWKTRYEPPPAEPPEALAKESAEELLRRLLAQRTIRRTSTPVTFSRSCSNGNASEQDEDGTGPTTGRSCFYRTRRRAGDVFN